ncbi:MAG: VCBS repeat-containing protein [Lentisphaeria bacterium]|nr:VCBS repeat-containing protein [Lentisphaeria bacterium]
MSKTWITRGFEAFRRGTFGNGGQNIYVSKKGILQRIYQYDLNHNGYFDLVFANCQNHHESAESYVYKSDGSREELPGQGCLTGCVADLYNRGWQDIILCGRYDMAAPYASTDIYFGGPDGYNENNHIRIPAPWAESVSSGYFTNSSRLALAFAMPFYHTVRVFEQTALGFEWDEFKDFQIDAEQLAAIDLDGDGYDELIAVKSDFSFGRVYWGSPEGLSEERFSDIPLPAAEEIRPPLCVPTLESNMEKKLRVAQQIRAVELNGKKLISWATGIKVIFYGTDKDRNIVRTKEVEAPGSICAMVKDDVMAIAARPDSLILKGNKLTGKVATPQASDGIITPEGIYFSNNGDHQSYTCEIVQCQLDGTVIKRFTGEDTRRIFDVRNPGKEAELLAVNHFSRSSIGFDKSYVYFGSAEGYSKDNMIAVPGWCAVDAMCADLDDDGWTELVIANNSENSLHLDPGHHLHHFGPNGFEPERTTTLQSNIGWGVVCGDFNHDGFLEIATPCDHWCNLRIFYGKDNFQTFDTIELDGKNSLRWLTAVDLNGNGYLDLVVPYDNHPLILWGGPEGYSLERSKRLSAYKSLNATAADLTRNGYPDLIIGTHIHTPVNGRLPDRMPHHSYVHIYWNGPEGLSESRKCILRGDAADSFAVADFNNDGWLDLFVGSYHGGKDRDINSFLYWNREGKFKELDRDLLYTHSASGCIAADFNEDGYIDLAVANHKVDGDHQGWSAIWWNGEKGFNSERCTKLPTNGPHGMCSNNPGNVLDRSDAEYYTSEVFIAQEVLTAKKVLLDAEIPPKCYVKVAMRSADDPEALENAAWSNWVEFNGNSAMITGLAGGKVWQYKLMLGAKNFLRTPRITAVKVEWI